MDTPSHAYFWIWTLPYVQLHWLKLSTRLDTSSLELFLIVVLDSVYYMFFCKIMDVYG